MDFQDSVFVLLSDLEKAIRKMVTNTHPPTSPPRRSRQFSFCNKITWPLVSRSFEVMDWFYVMVNGRRYSLIKNKDLIVKEIIKCVGNQHQKSIRVLRRIQAAINWCLARTEGRKRDAQEIMRQQSKIIEALDSEAAIRRLAE